MALFSNFCNICYKIDNESLKDISEVNMKYLNNILITFVGHADIINYNAIYLCQLCCEELTRVDKFREMCLSNLIQMRQRYINMKLEDSACAVQNTLQKFVYEEALRKSSLEKSDCSVSISTYCHGIIKSPEYVNEDYLVFNRQVTNLQLETNECDIKGACSEISGINSMTECDESRVAVTNEGDIKNEMLTHSESTRLEKFEEEPDEDYDVSDANNDNKSDTSQIGFIKEEYDLKNERENSDSENFTLKNDENESGVHANLDDDIYKMPFVYNSGRSVIAGIACAKEELNVKQENTATIKSLELQTMEDGFGDGLTVAFQIANVSTIVNMEEGEHGNIRSEDAEVGMKLRSRGSNNVDGGIGDIENNTIAGEEDNEKTCNRRTADVQRKGPQMCQHCHKQFPNLSKLITHMRTHTGDKPYKCTICDKAFTTNSDLNKHARTHTNERPYKCNVCEKSFTQSSSLIIHQRIHTNTHPYKCTQCSKTYTHSGNLTSHMRVHTGQRPYKCSVCDKAFTQSCHLTVHMRVHTGQRPYKCSVCDKAFTHSCHLTAHMRVHTGQRPYKCSVCDKAFTQNCHLTKHKRTHGNTLTKLTR